MLDGHFPPPPPAPPPTWSPLDDRWVAWLSHPSHAEWSTLCSIEDWIRIHLLAPRVQCDWRTLSLHSPRAFAARLSELVLSPEAIAAADSPLPLGQLKRVLSSLHGPGLSRLLPHLTDDVWTFAARWLLSFPRTGAAIRLTYSHSLGLGLYSPKGLPALTPLPTLWGHTVPIPQPAFDALMADDAAATAAVAAAADATAAATPGPATRAATAAVATTAAAAAAAVASVSFVTKTYITAAHPRAPDTLGPPHLILGPINLANHSCGRHATLVPDAPPGPAQISPVSYLSASDWRTAHAPKEVPSGSPLTISYSEQETLPCPDCLPPLSADTPNHDSWCNLAEKGPAWLTPLLAEDWVILSIIAPMSNRPPEQLPTHCVGRVRRSLLDRVPSWPEILDALPPTWSVSSIRTNFRRAFAHRLEVRVRVRVRVTLTHANSSLPRSRSSSPRPQPSGTPSPDT